MYILLTALFIFLCSACTNEEWSECSSKEVIVYGNSVDESGNSRTSSPRLLDSGTRMALYAKGGIQIDGQILTLNQTIWKGEQSLNWTDSHSPVNICAFTPPLSNCNQQLYHSGQLQDMLIAQKEYSYPMPICLCFEHMFAKINFHVEEGLNRRLLKLIVTPREIVSQIEPYTAQLVTRPIQSEEISQYSSYLLPDKSGIYPLILAPSDNQAVNIEIHTTDGKILKKEVHSVKVDRNQSYICNIKEATVNVGISNEEDFIAFTYLINGKPYGNRTLNEFGKTINGKTTYYLLNDINFSNVNPNRLKRISPRNDFNDTFDGKGKRIAGLKLISESGNDEGLFGRIGNQGIVKNLTIQNSSVAFTKTGFSQGTLCGYNHGMIHNCHIQNCTVISPKTQIGGLVGKNSGTIVNCSVNGLTFTSNRNDKKTIMFGGISSSNNASGILLNCYVSNLQRGKDKKKILNLSAICNINEGKMSNCLTEKCSIQYHPYCRDTRKDADHCYYPSEKGTSVELTDEERTRLSIWAYNNLSEKEEFVQKLNDWIGKEGKLLFPHLKFNRWKMDTSGNISFE